MRRELRLNRDYALGFGIDASVLGEFIGEERSFLICHEAIACYLVSAIEEAAEFTGDRVDARLVGNGRNWVLSLDGQDQAVLEVLSAFQEITGLESI